MSIHEHDSTHNSSGNAGESEAILSPAFIPSKSSSLPSNSNRPPPGLVIQSIIPGQSPDNGKELPSLRQKGNYGFLEMLPYQQEENVGEMAVMGSQDQTECELGLDLGRKLARLELGNKLNNDQLDKIEQRGEIIEEALVLENSRVNDLEGKVISMEARLSSVENQGFVAKEKIENLEKNFKMKDNEISVLREILSNQMTERAKLQTRFSKLDQGNRQLTTQFVILLKTCEMFNEELQSLKKMNLELKRELKKKESAEVYASNSKNSSPSNQISAPGCYPRRVFQNSSKTKRTSNDSSTTCTSDCQNVTTQLSPNPSFLELTPSAGHKNAKTRTEVNCINPKSQPSGYYAQEYIPQSIPTYYYPGPGGPFYFPQAPQPIVPFHNGPATQGHGLQATWNADFSGYH